MRITSGFLSLILKSVGGIILISSMATYFFLFSNPRWEDVNWQINLTNSLVDQGIVPLIAISFLLVGWWVEDSENPTRPGGGAPRLIVFIIASILGLVYLLTVPLHYNNISRVSSDIITQIQQRSEQQRAQLEGFVSQLEAISKNPQKLKVEIQQREEIIKAGGRLPTGQQLAPEQLQLLTIQTAQLKQISNLVNKPEELKSKFQQARSQLEKELKKLEEEEKSRARGLALQQGLRTSISSLMLAIAYIVIGWFGLRIALFAP
ncbi:MAG: HpsJ family protein [Geminocystis sp.]|nr:HpsJ family protein [Geminocystis sp.]HIK37070.1 hypothetical protein [Geminocystis sp. M7585_C2015_104]MCS7148966.1 HpsJ family protein [Geminocystis sp.]MCX8077556.1 HpsJ family protein [Geminocystis sp.]MDW8117187.1 HpsJ family protein [Geminocystis sp.]